MIFMEKNLEGKNNLHEGENFPEVDQVVGLR
jgi:hypothetical protein